MENIQCVFCKQSIIEASAWQDELFYIMFDAHPVSPGHILIIPKRHISTLEDLNKIEWENLFKVIKEGLNLIICTDLRRLYRDFSGAAKTEIMKQFCNDALTNPRINTRPDGYNHGVNSGTAAGQTVAHLHWHIIPRYQGDVPNPVGGVRFVIPDKANYKK